MYRHSYISVYFYRNTDASDRFPMKGELWVIIFETSFIASVALPRGSVITKMKPFVSDTWFCFMLSYFNDATTGVGNLQSWKDVRRVLSGMTTWFNTVKMQTTECAMLLGQNSGIHESGHENVTKRTFKLNSLLVLRFPHSNIKTYRTQQSNR